MRGCTLAVRTRVIRKKAGANNQETREDNVRAYPITKVIAPLALLALSTHAGAQPAAPTSPTSEVLRVTRLASPFTSAKFTEDYDKATKWRGALPALGVLAAALYNPKDKHP